MKKERYLLLRLSHDLFQFNHNFQLFNASKSKVTTTIPILLSLNIELQVQTLHDEVWLESKIYKILKKLYYRIANKVVIQNIEIINFFHVENFMQPMNSFIRFFNQFFFCHFILCRSVPQNRILSEKLTNCEMFFQFFFTTPNQNT